MIQSLYLKRAASIRKEYLSIIRDIESYENIAKELSDSISQRTKELEQLLENLNNNRVSNADSAKQNLHNIMIQTEDDMNKVDKSIDVLSLKIERLKSDEMVLYREIKQSYFNLTDEEIKNEIQEHLKKLNLS